MGDLVVTEFLTVDGVMEDPGGSEKTERGGWAFKFGRGAEGDKFKLDELLASDALLLGRVTYEGFAQAWPGRKDEAGFADKFNNMPKHVVSRTLTEPLGWNNSRLVKGDLAEGVRKLKEQYEGDIVVHGSGQLVRSLAELDLVDRYNLMVFPTILGRGKCLFGDTHEAERLSLASSSPVGSDGVMVAVYERAR